MTSIALTPNVTAFLTMLSHSEGTDRPPAPENPYRCCYGYRHVIADLSDHPAITGEWKGEIITKGIYAGEPSTAAGRYPDQPTELDRRAGQTEAAGLHRASQDLWVVGALADLGALDLIISGQVGEAITRCRNVWASLPGGASGQPQASFAELMRAYTSAGGALV